MYEYASLMNTVRELEAGEYETINRSSADYVRWVQQSLNRIFEAGLVVDGIYGPRTRSAVQSFQRSAGLAADGIVGPITEGALIAAGAARPPGASPTPSPSLSPSAARNFLVRGVPLPPPASLQVLNTLSAGVPSLRASGRTGQTVNEMIVHETVTTSVSSTVTVLQNRGLGVHLIMGPDGSLTQHADLGDDVTWHAGSTHNGVSVGVEVVNPYYPRYLKAGMPWSRTIQAGWAHEGRYVLPTPAQAEAVAQLLNWITSPSARGLSIPRVWIGLSGHRLAMSKVPGAERRRPGIYAHTYFNHADGSWLVLYSWLRLEAGYPPADAYAEAARRAETSRKYVDLP